MLPPGWANHYLSQPARYPYKHVTSYRRANHSWTAIVLLCGAGYFHKWNK